MPLATLNKAGVTGNTNHNCLMTFGERLNHMAGRNRLPFINIRQDYDNNR